MYSNFKRISYNELLTAVKVYERSSLTIKGKFNMGIRTYPYKTIYEGTPIAFHVKEEDKGREVVESLSDGHGVCELLVFHRIFIHTEVPYVIGFSLAEDRSQQEYTINRNEVRIIPLEKRISRVAYSPSRPIVVNNK